MLKKLKECRGSAYVDAGFVIVGLLFVFALIISIFPFFSNVIKLSNSANELTRHIEMEGHTNDINSEIARLEQVYGISLTLDKIDKTGNIPHGADFTLTLKSSATIGIGDLKVTLPISKTATGRGEIYWK